MYSHGALGGINILKEQDLYPNLSFKIADREGAMLDLNGFIFDILTLHSV